jgi:hypothetical protein
VQFFWISYKILVAFRWISSITKANYSDFLGSVENLLYVQNWVVWFAMLGILDVSMFMWNSCVSWSNEIYVCDIMHFVFVFMLDCCTVWISVCTKGWILFLTDNKQVLNPSVVFYDIQYLSHCTICVFVCLSCEATMCLAYVISVELCSKTIRRFVS